MRNLLARRHAAALEGLARARVLLAFDFDGTLAPIVARPAAAAMRRRTARLLAEACRLYPCAIVSGRARADVLERLDGARPNHVVGNHGLEPTADADRYRREVAAARRALARRLAAEPGVEIEDKSYTLSVHYRRAPGQRAARAAIARAIGALPAPVRVIPGKSVVNVLPADAPGKGDAVRRLRRLDGLDRCLYVGDDATDEEVFRLGGSEPLVGVRVGASRSSAAAYCIVDQGEIDALLGRLVKLRGGGKS